MPRESVRKKDREKEKGAKGESHDSHATKEERASVFCLKTAKVMCARKEVFADRAPVRATTTSQRPKQTNNKSSLKGGLLERKPKHDTQAVH